MYIDLIKTAFIAVDVQTDFCPGGALAVPGGDEVVPLVNNLAAHFPISVATQDWHPLGHISFASSHPGKKPYDADESSGRSLTLWPDHCVQGSAGASFHPQFNEAPYRLVLRKGFRPNLDSYSAFFENDGATPTGLEGFLRGLGIHSVVLAGLAFDYCVYFSALDALSLDFKVIIAHDATRSVDHPAGNAEHVRSYLSNRGVLISAAEEILGHE
ncbi:MAG TPA: bifunctional nicotinamidase/pyrazinamidase [Spirochaetaceae bacterium]|jgi:nicotinamidase/pyrazinamidase|nr:bifunctional nicotinamidase/pyrazinamidase [Spirochaetaceae bacterium]